MNIVEGLYNRADALDDRAHRPTSIVWDAEFRMYAVGCREAAAHIKALEARIVDLESGVHAAFSEGFGCGTAERDRMAAPWPADPAPLDETAYWLHSEARVLIQSLSAAPSNITSASTSELQGEQHNTPPQQPRDPKSENRGAGEL